MGSIKPVFIKRTAQKLIESSKDKFSTDFKQNKLAVSELVECGKEIRNRIAGYISTQMKPKPEKKYRPKPETTRRPRVTREKRY